MWLFFSAVSVPARSMLEKGLSSVRNITTHAQQRASSKGTYTPIPERSLLDVYPVHLHVHNSKTSIYTCRHIPERRRSRVMNATILPLKQVTWRSKSHTHTGEKPYKCDQCIYSSIALKWILWRGTSASALESYKSVQCNFSIRISRILRTQVRRQPNAPITIAQKGWASVHRK